MEVWKDEAMTREDQLRALAELDGWCDVKLSGRLDGQLVGFPSRGVLGTRLELPDYLNDLNACHRIELNLSEHGHDVFVAHLGRLTWRAVSATAAQRCEALLRTMARWKDKP